MTVTPYSAKAHSTGMGTASKESLKAKKSIWEKVFRNRMKKYPHSSSNPLPLHLSFRPKKSPRGLLTLFSLGLPWVFS